MMDLETSKFSEEQIIGFLRQAEAGMPIGVGVPRGETCAPEFPLKSQKLCLNKRSHLSFHSVEGFACELVGISQIVKDVAVSSLKIRRDSIF
jgi:hypothetical protein